LKCLASRRAIQIVGGRASAKCGGGLAGDRSEADDATLAAIGSAADGNRRERPEISVYVIGNNFVEVRARGQSAGSVGDRRRCGLIEQIAALACAVNKEIRVVVIVLCGRALDKSVQANDRAVGAVHSIENSLSARRRRKNRLRTR